MTADNGTYYEELAGNLILRNTQSADAGPLEVLQKIIFPTLASDELIKAAHYLRHLEVFPEGQFVITDNDKVIGMTTTMRTNFDFENQHHTFRETIAGGWLSHHNPNGEWLYGLDMGVLPAYRGRGLARSLYGARRALARTLGLKGQLTVGMMSGYGAVSNDISGEQYYEELREGRRNDPTLTPQMKVGFVPVALLPEYLNDPVCGNYGVLIRLDINREV